MTVWLPFVLYMDYWQLNALIVNLRFYLNGAITGVLIGNRSLKLKGKLIVVVQKKYPLKNRY